MRKPRILQDGALYHVTARANRKEMILDTDEIKELFLEVLRRAKGKYAFRLENFCIMGNHFHLMVRPEGTTNLSRLMQWVMSVFAMAYNRMRGLVGHVWGSRFFSRIVSCLQEFLKIFRYIDDNPVEAHQVHDKRVWRYGGLWHHRAGSLDFCSTMESLLGLTVPEHTQIMLIASEGQTPSSARSPCETARNSSCPWPPVGSRGRGSRRRSGVFNLVHHLDPEHPVHLLQSC